MSITEEKFIDQLTFSLEEQIAKKRKKDFVIGYSLGIRKMLDEIKNKNNKAITKSILSINYGPSINIDLYNKSPGYVGELLGSATCLLESEYFNHTEGNDSSSLLVSIEFLVDVLLKFVDKKLIRRRLSEIDYSKYLPENKSKFLKILSKVK